MVARMLHTLKTSPFSVALGLVIGTGFAMSSPILADWAQSEYDARFPVWRETVGSVQERRGDAVVIELRGVKSRECRFLRINAQTEHLGELRNARITRLDETEVGATRPLGQQHIGMWVVVPVTSTARAVLVTVEHLCGDRLVLGKFATVRLTND